MAARIHHRKQGRQGKVPVQIAGHLVGEGRCQYAEGDVGPIDFDPVTNSQEPDVKSFKVVAEKLEADKAVIAVTITGRPRGQASRRDVRYNFVRDDENGRSTISARLDGEAWSIRDILSESLKQLT